MEIVVQKGMETAALPKITVAALIAELEKLPADAVVLVRDGQAADYQLASSVQFETLTSWYAGDIHKNEWGKAVVIL